MNGIIDSNQKIVSSGLRLSLDAAQLRSYPTTGTTWSDLSGNGNNATLTNGPTFNSGNGGSIFTDGTNDFITTPYVGSATSSYTFATWFKNDNYSEDKYPLVRGRDTVGSGWSLLVAIASSGVSVSAVITSVPSVQQFTAVGTSTLALNQWYYLTGVWTAGGSIKHYVNGVLETTVNTTSTNLRFSVNGWGIGTVNQTNFTSGFNAITQVYDRVLTDAEILQNYNAQKSRFGL